MLGSFMCDNCEAEPVCSVSFPGQLKVKNAYMCMKGISNVTVDSFLLNNI